MQLSVTGITLFAGDQESALHYNARSQGKKQKNLLIYFCFFSFYLPIWFIPSFLFFLVS